MKMNGEDSVALGRSHIYDFLWKKENFFHF